MLHPGTFDFLTPTDEQKAKMAVLRAAGADFADLLDRTVPEGPDKTYAIRKLREVSMWANVAITRLPDGTPRT